MTQRRRSWSVLWLLLILLPVVQSASAQTSGGVAVTVALLEPLDSSSVKTGQVFSATVAESVMSGKRVVLAKGTAVQGRVTQVTRPGHTKAPATITLLLTNVLGTHSANAFQSQALQVDGRSYGVRDVKLAVNGTGAAAETAAAYTTRKQELVIPLQTPLTFVVEARSLGIAPVETHTPTIVQASVRSGGAANRDREQDAYDSLIFSERDQAIIRSYYRNRSGQAAPALAKRDGNPPPGAEKQLRANDTLPPGLQKRITPLPLELDRQLPRLPRGYSRAIVDGRAMTLDANNRIVDVFVAF